MTDWASILNKKPEDAERPKPTPTGNYIAVVQGFEYKQANNEKKTPYVQYQIKLVMPHSVDGPDPQALSDMGGMEKVAARTMNLDFYMTDDSAWRHREWLEKVAKVNFGGRGWQPVIEEVKGKQLIVHIAHTISKKDNSTIYANIDDSAPL